MSLNTLTSSLEDYLEAIYEIIEERQAVKPRDIAKRLNVSQASVTGALRSLSEKGLINYAPYDIITFTSDGATAAKDVIKRHSGIRNFLMDILSIDYAVADKAACIMEHDTPKIVLDRFDAFAKYLKNCPIVLTDWVEKQGFRCHPSQAIGECEHCSNNFISGEAAKRSRKKIV